MIKLRIRTMWMVAVPIMVLATSGCATKKYVRQQVNPVNTRVSQLDKKTNEQIAYLNNQQKRDMSQVNERISTTDQKVSELAEATQQAQGSAARAMETADANSAKIAANSAATETLASGVANAMNYQLVEKGDVTFAFGKATLTPAAKTALDAIVMKFKELPRGVVELAGFTDPVGSVDFNLALSRRRAQAVERYLVLKSVPLRSIHIVGLGKEGAPEEMAIMDPNASKAELHRMARRVRISVFGAGDITQGTASRSQE